jgi:GPI inositol-deacylase
MLYLQLLPPCIFYFICGCNSISKVEFLSCRSFLAASFRSITQKKDLYKSKMGDGPVLLSKSISDGLQQLLPMDDSPRAPKSFTDSQLELFDYRHGIMILHLLTTLMFAPSLVAWLQVCHS